MLLVLLLLPPTLPGDSFSFINIACTDNSDYTLSLRIGPNLYTVEPVQVPMVPICYQCRHHVFTLYST